MSTAQAQKTPGPRVGVRRRATCVVKETLKVFAQHPRSETERMETFRVCGTEDSDTLCLCRLSVPKPAERYFLQGFHRWHVDWAEVVAVEGIVLPSDPVLLSLQAITGLIEKSYDPLETSGRMCFVARPSAVSLDRVSHQYARTTTGIGTDQLWAALRQSGAATLTSREDH